MSVTYTYKGKLILKCQNAIFCRLYDCITDIIDEKNISLNKNLTKLIKYLQLGGDGIGFDLSEYITSKDDLVIFINLVREGLDKIYSEIPASQQKPSNVLEEFYNELLKIRQSFL